jgi:hypothetical protein
MRAKFLLSGAGFFALLLASSYAHAQFQQPTGDELKMTSDPKAPGAAAVYLNMEEIDDDPLHYQSFYARIKVLSEKGKELATVNLPYMYGDSKITDIKARTIHADGTVIPLEGKPEDLVSAKNGDHQISRKVFNLPKVEVGSILEYRYILRYDDNHFSSPMWEIQRPYFVHKAHYVFTPFENFKPGATHMASSRFLVDAKGRSVNSLIWWMHLPEGVNLKTEAVGRYVLDVNDIPAIPEESWMPPIQSLLYKVFFYYMPAMSAGQFWADAGKDWSKQVDHFAEQSNDLHAVVAGLVAPSDSELDKAKKLYTAVQALDNTDYSRKKSEAELKNLKLKEARHAIDVWKQKSGSSDEIAMLYLAMLRAAGLKAYALQVVNRNRGVFDPSYMNMSQFDDLLVRLEVGDKVYMLDPGEKACPFESLNWKHSNARGLVQSTAGPALGNTLPQSYKDNTTTRSGFITLDAHGGLTGQLQWTMRGQEAIHWRQIALRNDPDEVKKQFDQAIESEVPKGIEVHVDHFLGLDDPEVNLIAAVKVSGEEGMATAKRLLLPALFFSTRGGQVFAEQEKRATAVDMEYGEQVVDQITYVLPEGYVVEGAPADATLQWPGHAMYLVKSQSAPGRFTIARRLARAFDQAKPEEYKDLRGFYLKVASADQQQIVLTAAPAAAKGN